MTASPAPALIAPKTFAEAEANLAAALPGYESRPQQQALATAVERALATGKHLLAEAGCGTGKSLGSMIPAILSGKKVVVSTATIALQEQYANKDVPFLQEHLGKPFTFALLKGRSNYFCLNKAANLGPGDLAILADLERELADNPMHTGDKEHFETPLTDQEFRAVASTGDECPGKRECPFGEVCYAEAAKARAKAADVVVTNHALLFTDLKVREVTDGFGSMLGEYDAVIVDEAHEVEEWATSALGDNIRETGIRRLVTEVRNFAGQQASEDRDLGSQAVLDATAAVWALLPQTEGPESGMTLRYFAAHFEAFASLIDALRAMAEKVSDIDVRDRKAEGRRTLLATRASNYADKFAMAVTAEDSRLVRWIEKDQNGNRMFHTAPLNVGEWLNDWLWSRVPSILISATLSVGGDFDYIQSRIGLPEPTTLNVGTPFDFGSQALLYVPPASDPNPKAGQAWRTAALVKAQELIDASGGGALLLFTSKSAMVEMESNLSHFLARRGFTSLMQGRDGSKKELAARFAEDTHSVLFALKSFMTGVDFAGDTCRLVIIDKLPFPVPTDVMFDARCADVNRKAGRDVAFTKMSIPAMTLTLLQAYGRLIRSKTDRGVVAILDSRLSSTGYGRKIVESLPDSPATTDLADVRAFYGK